MRDLIDFEWDDQFIWKLLVTKEITWDKTDVLVILLDEYGNELVHPCYKPRPAKGMLEIPSNDREDVRLHIRPNRFTWTNTSKQSFAASAAAIVHEDTGYRMMGMDFGYYAIPKKSVFTLNTNNNGLLTVTKHLWMLITNLASLYRDEQGRIHAAKNEIGPTEI